MTGRHRAISVFILALLGIATCFLSLLPPVSAHQHIVAGESEFIVGWREEPPVVGVLNGLDLGIFWRANGTAVEGVQDRLSATLTTGPASMVQNLTPQFGRAGWYTFDVLPTREGSYSVRIRGSLNSTAIDFVVALETVMARSEIEFPVPDPLPSELARSIQAVEAENAALRAQLGMALAIAIVGVVIGVVGMALAAIAWRRGVRKP